MLCTGRIFGTSEEIADVPPLPKYLRLLARKEFRSCANRGENPVDQPAYDRLPSHFENDEVKGRLRLTASLGIVLSRGEIVYASKRQLRSLAFVSSLAGIVERRVRIVRGLEIMRTKITMRLFATRDPSIISIHVAGGQSV